MFNVHVQTVSVYDFARASDIIDIDFVPNPTLQNIGWTIGCDCNCAQCWLCQPQFGEFDRSQFCINPKISAQSTGLDHVHPSAREKKC